MADLVYNQTKHLLLKGDLDFDTADIRALLVKSGFTANADHDVLSDLTLGTHEISGSGYARETLDNTAVTLDDTNDRAYVDDTVDLAFGSIAAGETIAGCVIYLHVTNDSDSVPLVFLDLTDTPTNGQAVSVQLAATGFLLLT